MPSLQLIVLWGVPCHAQCPTHCLVGGPLVMPGVQLIVLWGVPSACLVSNSLSWWVSPGRTMGCAHKYIFVTQAPTMSRMMWHARVLVVSTSMPHKRGTTRTSNNVRCCICNTICGPCMSQRCEFVKKSSFGIAPLAMNALAMNGTSEFEQQLLLSRNGFEGMTSDI